MNQRGQTFSIVALVISLSTILITLFVISLIPHGVIIQGVDELLVRGQLYSLTVNALAHASRGGDFRAFLNRELQHVSHNYIPLKEVYVKAVVVREGLSKCIVEYRTIYGYEKFEVYLELELLRQYSYYDPSLSTYVVVLEVKVACDQYYPKRVDFYTREGYRTSHYREGGHYVITVYMNALSHFKLYCEDWRGIRTYLDISP